jgi:hypothetical protein
MSIEERKWKGGVDDEASFLDPDCKKEQDTKVDHLNPEEIVIPEQQNDQLLISILVRNETVTWASPNYRRLPIYPHN